MSLEEMKAQLKAEGWDHHDVWGNPERTGHISITDIESELNKDNLAGLLKAKKELLAQVLAGTDE